MVRTCGIVMSIVKTDMVPMRRFMSPPERKAATSGVVGLGCISMNPFLFPQNLYVTHSAKYVVSLPSVSLRNPPAKNRA